MNFFSKASNFITDAISGEKTKDAQYQLVCSKMSILESGITSFKTILKGYKTYSEPFSKYLKTLNDSINKIYKYSPLKIEITEIINSHTLILKDLENMGKIISKLYSKTSEWDTIFVKAKESIKIREEKRKNFDHYEQKLIKIEGEKNNKKIKDFVQRNIEKYKIASKEYIEASEKSFEIIKHTIKISWELANPIIGELIACEIDLFGKIYNKLNCYENINIIFQEIMKGEFNPDLHQKKAFYDPKKYIKSKLLNKKNKSYEHNFIRKTNTFGKVSEDRSQKFINIKDKLLIEDDEE